MTNDNEYLSDIDSVDGYEAYVQYISLKAHFNSSYDWKKHQGRIRSKRESYDKRADKKFFQIIKSRYTPLEINQIFLANFVYDKHLWIGELLSEHCIQIWHEWKGRLNRMYYQFEEDIKNSLLEVNRRKGYNFKNGLKYMIRKPKNSHPLVLRFLWGGMFTMESYLLLSEVLDLKKVYARHLLEDRIWEDFEFKVSQYRKFLGTKIHLDKTKEIIKKIVKE